MSEIRKTSGSSFREAGSTIITLENINKLNEINKKIRLNKIMNTQDDNVGYNKDNNEYINDNHQKEDPLDNIIINDNYYKAPSKETDKITNRT